MDKLLTMSGPEINRVEVMQRLKAKSLNQREAGKILDMSVRQVKRLFKKYREKGAAGLVSQRRARVSNNRLDEATRTEALDLLGSKYRGFGPLQGIPSCVGCGRCRVVCPTGIDLRPLAERLEEVRRG